MLQKVKIIYKGDVITSYIYIGLSLIMFVISSLLYVFVNKLGYYYLSLGMSLFALYSLGKGILLYRVAKSRLNYYMSDNAISDSYIDEEFDYTNYRLMKKEGNRRRYAWTFGIASIIAVLGIFMQEKGLIIGTMIPIVLFAATEFSIGLLVEFRLWEFHRMLKKAKGILEENE